jgi:hypothetical protein
MALGYQPLYIRKPETGLVQNRQEHILPDDAYPIMENIYLFREQRRRRQGLATLGRFRRSFDSAPATILLMGVNGDGNVLAGFGLEATASIVPGTVVITDTISPVFYTDAATLNGNLIGNPSGSGTINYSTGAISIPVSTGHTVTAAFDYYPGLPVMGLRSRELNGINVEQTIGFDTKYAYNFTTSWQEFIPGTTWTGTDYQFFWSTNYWVGDGNAKIFWVTNFSGPTGDPIRYTNGSAWVDFSPQIDASANLLTQCLALLPFRGRLVAFNTLEGPNLAGSTAFTNRIRWAAIGTPFTVPSAIVTTVSPDAWRDDIRGKGGFLDIPTSESIVSVGFVRDNLVIYCERSTWQLRYTGRTIAPFQIEKVNSELGAESTFSAIQFDTSLVGIGDKGVVECDSYKSERIDIKIPDLVFQFKNVNNGTERVHGIRDFQQRLAYWTYVYNPDSSPDSKFPNRRLVYNYENDSWAIFTDSLTALGTFQASIELTWEEATFPWSEANFPWLNVPSQFPSIIGGNQQGYVMYLSSNLEPKVSNDPTLYISAITSNNTTPTALTVPNHNLVSGQVIRVTDIPAGTPYASSLNNHVFGVIIDPNNDPLNSFELWVYDPTTLEFSIPQLDASAAFVGYGQVSVRDNFNMTSKKFNFLEQGENIQMGYVDLLMLTTESGSITMNVFLDYNRSTPINLLPENVNPVTNLPDTFFNSVINTFQAGGIDSEKNFQRIFCAVRGNFVTLQYTLSNQQLTTVAQESDVQIDAETLWIRPAGKQLNNI